MLTYNTNIIQVTMDLHTEVKPHFPSPSHYNTTTQTKPTPRQPWRQIFQQDLQTSNLHTTSCLQSLLHSFGVDTLSVSETILILHQATCRRTRLPRFNLANWKVLQGDIKQIKWVIWNYLNTGIYKLNASQESQMLIFCFLLISIKLIARYLLKSP